MQLGFDIKDASYSERDSRDYHLIAGLTDSGLNMAILNANLQKYVFLKTIEFGSQRLLKKHEQSIANFPELKKDYRKKLLSVSTPYYTLVPAAYYDEALAGNYYAFNFDVKNQEKINADFIGQLNAYLVYPLLMDHTKINNLFQPDNIVHAATPYIISILTNLENYLSKRLFVEIERRHIRVVLIENGKLMITNSFPYKTAEDVLFHIMNIGNRFNLDANLDKYYFSGLINRDSEIYRLLFRYVRYPMFLTSLNGITFPQVFSQQHLHSCYNLFAVALCV